MKRDWFAEAFGATVDDIRKRLVEEPWFGREVTPPHARERNMAEQLGWEGQSVSPAERIVPKHDPTHDIEPDR